MHEASAEHTFPRQSRVHDRYPVGPMHHQWYVGIGYDRLRPPHTIPHDCTTPTAALADILVLGGAGCPGGPLGTGCPGGVDLNRSYAEWHAHKAPHLGLLVSQHLKNTPAPGSVKHWCLVHGRSITAMRLSGFSSQIAIWSHLGAILEQ